MPPLIQIPDSVFTDAANAIAQLRSLNEQNINSGDIEKVLRSYVWLGSNKKIMDFSSSLSDDDQNTIVTNIQTRTRDIYSFFPDYDRTFTNMRTMETLSATGQVSTRVARPRAAQEEYEAQLAASPQGPNVLTAGIESFFGVIKTAIDSTLKGLGINIPIDTILLIAAAIFVIILLK